VCALLVAITLGLSFTGCGKLSAPIPGTDISNSVDSVLQPQVDRKVAKVNFDTLISGSWNELIIVCKGSTQASLDDSLGFEWSAGPSLADPSFLAMLVFSTGTKVEKYFSAGQDDALVDHWYFTPCSVPADSGYRPGIGPVKLERTTSSVTFHFEEAQDPRFSFWYVASDDLHALMR
jgi:hypothetical protein